MNKMIASIFEITYKSIKKGFKTQNTVVRTDITTTVNINLSIEINVLIVCLFIKIPFYLYFIKLYHRKIKNKRNLKYMAHQTEFLLAVGASVAGTLSQSGIVGNEIVEYIKMANKIK